MDVAPNSPDMDYKIELAKALFDIEVTKASFVNSIIAEPTCQAAHMDVLLSSGRKIHASLGDGNCLFRSFSKELLSNETHHLRIRTLLTDTVKWNGDKFKGYLAPPLTGKSITEHVQTMRKEFTWGTHIEIYAMASVLQVPIHLYTQKKTARLTKNIIGRYFNH